ncbi:MAG: conserved rane protein of unknown function [Blastococcus sp.]|jgi:hypothetical protein|nr:conserved rane protein of unknown function [Blastococcus sp.]
MTAGTPARAPGTPGTPAPSEPSSRPSSGSVAAGARALAWGQQRPTSTDKPRRDWREQVLIRAGELSGLATWMATRGDGASDETLRKANADLDAAARGHLEVARDAALGTTGNRGARMERAVGHLDAAEAVLLRRSPDDYLEGSLPGLLAHVQAHLPPSHPQRLRVEALALPPTDEVIGPLSGEDRTALAEAARAAGWAARREHTRLRSFRTIVALTSLALLLLALAIGAVGAARPEWMPLCFAPQGANAVVCPTATAATGGSDADPATATQIATVVATTARGPDTGLVMLVGLAGAAVTAAAALRRIRGTSTPYAVPVTLLLLKLPTGALTAFLGLILLHGNFVPGLSALDSSDQILAWALVFGAAQQLVTGLVDKKAQSVLDSVGSTPMTAEKE